VTALRGILGHGELVASTIRTLLDGMLMSRRCGVSLTESHNMLPKVSELLVLEDHPNVDARCIRVSLRPGGDTDALARRLAIDIVRRLTEPIPETFGRWHAHLNGGPALDDISKDEVLAYVGADFSNPDDTTRIEGAVAEHLWASVAEALDGGWGRPLYVEHDHFSVIDHGPDGLSVYDVGEVDLGFRLWESKRHAARRTVTTTISTAARQLRDHGSEYLARISKVLQTNPNPRVAHLGGTIVRAWKEVRSTSAVGVSIGRSTGDGLPDRPFVGLRRHFKFDDSSRREGVLIEIDDLPAFAMNVRHIVLNGLI
jgi:hypothetical protein